MGGDRNRGQQSVRTSAVAALAASATLPRGLEAPRSTLFAAVFFLGCFAFASASDPPTSRPASPSSSPGRDAGKNLFAVPARQWAADASKNEIKVIQYGSSYLRYRIHLMDAKGDQVRDVIESKQGSVARLIYKQQRPLTPAEDAAEHQRLQAMLESPSAFAKHIRDDSDGKKTAVAMIQLMPDAMLFDYAPGQPQRPHPEPRAADRPNDPPEIVLDFRPNPEWTPPTLLSQALTGLQGRIWIDAKTHHLTRIEGTVFRGVNFGFGIFAHIYPGGQLALEQVPAGDRWIFSSFSEHLTVRALMVRTLKENSELRSSNYVPMREMSYQDAIHLLLDTPLPDR